MKRIRPSGGRRLGKQDRRQLRVLYQDDAVVVLNKPAKMLAVPTDDSDLPSALSLLSAELESKRQRAFVVHRIDRRHVWDSALCKNLARSRSTRSTVYPTHPGAGISRSSSRPSPLERRDTRSLLSATRNVSKGDHERDPKSVRAELRYSVEHRLKGASLVRVSLVTGLQNQIRVQFSAIGHPVIADRKYNPAEKLERRITRVALHAAHLEFIHPRSGDSVCVDCEPPPDFQALLQALGLPISMRR